MVLEYVQLHKICRWYIIYISRWSKFKLFVCLVGQIKRGQSLPNRSSTYCILDPPRKKRRYRYHVHITPYSITLLVVNFEKCCCENWIVRICTLINFIAPVYMVHWYMFIKTFTYAGQSKQKGFFLSWKKLNELTSCLAEVNSQTVDSAF